MWLSIINKFGLYLTKVTAGAGNTLRPLTTSMRACYTEVTGTWDGVAPVNHVKESTGSIHILQYV